MVWKRIEQLYKIQGKVSYDDVRGIALESGYTKKAQVDHLIHEGERSGKLRADPEDLWYYTVALTNVATAVEKIKHKMTDAKMFEYVLEKYKEHRALSKNPAAWHEWVLGWKYEIGRTGLSVEDFETYAMHLIESTPPPAEAEANVEKRRVIGRNFEISEKTAMKRSAEAAAKYAWPERQD